ncbi:P-loop containing nucleoside triphosphate hydrolase protein [Chytriomyces sp. MP71]|nr:P-loop containing nucleoside triphosphate hydrolase protein [Chytriomyces sp. MP71]
MNQLLFSSSSISSGLCVSFVIFSVHTLMAPDYKMDPATAFTGLYLVQQFMEILSRLPWDAMLFFQAKVSMQRVAKFLDEPEIEQNFSESTNQHKTCIGFSKASFAFFGCSTLQGKSGTICLENIDLDFRVNGLNVVCGSTGSGKTSLCLALLGELDRVSGCTHLRDGKSAQPKVAYAAQCAWLLNATLRENVVMGAVFDEDRYHQTLEAAALIKDLDNFQAGDLTLIGEKGVNVSGGQKQRISIARALYSDANIVILDDPLSAVDAPTARHLLAYAICGPLLRNRTVILVTHAISLVLPVADFVVVMNGGKVLASGTASDLAKDLDVNDIHETMLEDAPASMSTGSVLKSSPRSLTSLTLRDSQALLHNEKVASGNVSLRVYTDYVKAAGGIKFALLFLGSFVLSIFVQFGNDYWLKRWSEAGQATRATSVGELYFDTFLVATPLAWNSPFTKTSLTESKRSQIQTSTAPPTTVIYYISIYGLFGLAVIISQNLNVLVTALSSKKASQKLHDRLLQALLGAPLRFFEVTPIGRILNRLSKDVSIIDQNVMSTVRWFLRCVFSAIMVIAVIASGSLAFLGAMIPIGWLAMKIGNMYLSASRELKRLESVSRSPIYNQFSESLNGVVTIRAYRQTDRFLHQNNNKVDNNHRFFYTLWACNRWLTLRTDFISATVVFCSGVTVLLARSYITKGWAGIILLYAGKFSDALVWVVRMHADMEMSLDSVERCVEYCEIEQEPPRVNEHYRPRQSWPEHGVIHVKNLSVRYALDQPRVLKDLNFTVKPGEKIGVVGRTGAGKSTLSLAFFRIVPFDEGTIEIDGMDIQKMGLHDLRSRLTIIPQDAVLFEGTIRSNLDPFDEYTDAEIWQVLRETHVLESLQQKAACTSTNLACHETLVEVESPESIAPFNLDHPVTENGNNFSQGQRQLFCMARALLRNARVVILDEATASIDGPTDARIQTTIRERLWDKTIFCIAHRLRSVADYDRILVLNYGEIVEYASPFELLMGEAMNVLDESKALISGQFASMCRESGEFETILEIARAAWDRKLD